MPPSNFHQTPSNINILPATITTINHEPIRNKL